VHKRWTREELIIAFNVYCRTPFGKLHKGNPDITRVAEVLGRTPSALAMKLCNFASLDPAHRRRRVTGLTNVSKADLRIWDEFNANWEDLAVESQSALEQIGSGNQHYNGSSIEIEAPEHTEAPRSGRVRLVQSFFRETVLASYSYKCAICLLTLPELLNASHIIPWSKSPERRVDPTNGLSLCTIHDRAFDRGLLTIDTELCVVLSDRAKQNSHSTLQTVALIETEGRPLTMPSRFEPDPTALQYHRELVFQG
jgi:hypothetical protein